LQITIASAVEEQTATTNEMARNIAQAAAGSGGIAANITAAADTAVSTRAGVEEARTAAAELARMSTELQTGPAVPILTCRRTTRLLTVIPIAEDQGGRRQSGCR
jgi:hypothetical protein